MAVENMAEEKEASAKVFDLADMRRKLRPPEPGSLAATLANIDAVRLSAQLNPLAAYHGDDNG